MAMLLEELKEKLALYCDVCLLCDILDIDEEELIERFEDKLLEHLNEMQEFCEEEQEEFSAPTD